MTQHVSGRTPDRWAIDGTLLLRAFQGERQFPVDVETLATKWSKQLQPDAPITRISERPLVGFEGALVDGRSKGKGWGIAYAQSITSDGRRRFTIAHELGHFLLHRDQAPDGGFQCSQEDMGRWDYENGQQEAEANRFAARLLMPLDDFRERVPPQELVTLQLIGDLAADRYGVSLMAAVLQWLDFTTRRVVFVCSKDGFVLWAKSSTPAWKSGAFIRTRSGPAFEVPEASPIRSHSPFEGARAEVRHRAGVWFDEPVHEEAIVSDRFELGLSLLHLDGVGSTDALCEDAAPDAFELMRAS